MQTQTGFFIESIREQLNEEEKFKVQYYDEERNPKEYFLTEELLKNLSYFQASNQNFKAVKPDETDPIIAVVSNMISRGLPTRLSILIEDYFLKTFQKSSRRVELGKIKYDYQLSNEELNLCFEALHLIEPRLKLNRANYAINDKLESDFERSFLFDFIPEQDNYLIQLLEPQRELSSLLNDYQNFKRQRTDFTLEFPYIQTVEKKEVKGLIVEIDGKQHTQGIQIILDNSKDYASQKAKWEVNRVRSGSEKTDTVNTLQYLEKYDFIKIIKKNYQKQLNEQWLDILQLTLSPIGIARVQKALVDLMVTGQLDWRAEKWKIAVIERDVPCACLATKDLEQLFENLFKLEGKERKIPEIELEIFVSKEFEQCKLNQKVNTQLISQFDKNKDYDAVLDIAILERANLHKTELPAAITIRSAHHLYSKRTFLTSQIINYGEICKKKNDEEYDPIPDKEKALTYFLRSIFRIRKFREGQLPILNRALQGQTVIGLLPTGGGKSLTYQLASLLQPGIVMVIDPIKSLMQDQVEGLKKNQIDASLYINSSLSTAERESAIEKMVQGETLFAFVSPERLQIQKFRDSLSKMYEQKVYFSYCVIDEAHCVSEWGHDFRTSYLSLGKNARDFCKIKSSETIPLFGLTATASFDVLSDVQRELQVGEEAIVKFNQANKEKLVLREELFNRVIGVEVAEEAFKNEFEHKQAYNEAKQNKILEILKEITLQLDTIAESNPSLKNEKFTSDTSKSGGLIFCPHKTGGAGVNTVKDKLLESGKKATYFYSADDDFDAKNKDNSQSKEISQNQSSFIKGNTQIMVATKAFGMGIDKPDIRYTIHFNYPSSIESFVQEAGRAGRDGSAALNYVLLGHPVFDKELLEDFFYKNFKGRAKEVLVLQELLEEITYPYQSQASSILEEVEEKFELEDSVYFSFYTPKGKKEPIQIYLNQDFQKGYGCLDLNTGLSVNTRFTKFDIQKSKDILNFIRDKILEKMPKDENVVAWLKTQTRTKPSLGIEKEFEQMSINEDKKIIIGFANNKTNLIAELLHKKDSKIDAKMVSDAMKFATEANDFFKNLKNQYWKSTSRNISLNEETNKKIENLFDYVRDKSDTDRAIYRLSILGAVQDYTVDYNSKTYSVEIKNLSDTAYKKNIANYYSRYLSEENKKIRVEAIDNRHGATCLRKCLGDLTDFVYHEIVSKRKAATKAMQEVCEKGLKNEEDMRKMIFLYFNAKYLRDLEIEGINYNLIKDTDEGNIDNDLKILWKYIDITSGGVDNLRHLLGSSMRLLTDKSQNPLFLLFKAFSLFLLESEVKEGKLIIKNERFFREAQDCFLSGMYAFVAKGQDYQEIIRQYKEKITDHNAELGQEIDRIIPLLEIREHKIWLQNFNQRFLQDYEH